MNYSRIFKEAYNDEVIVEFRLWELEATCKGRPIIIDTPKTTIRVLSSHGEWDWDDLDLEKGMDNFECNGMWFADNVENGEYVEDCDIRELNDEEFYNIVKKLVEDGEYYAHAEGIS